MSVYQKHLDEEALIVEAIKCGALDDPELNIPDHHIETGLAHIFFFGDRVFKQYKIVADPEHFIKGVLAPTVERQKFIERDFALNQHFSGGVYKGRYTHYLDGAVVRLTDEHDGTPHALYEMDRLDFTQNFHEKLLRGEVREEQLYELGRYTAFSVAESPEKAPQGVNWYELASKRVDFLETFIGWLSEEYKEVMERSECVGALRQHLKHNRIAYEAKFGDALVVTLDNHDENIFFREDTPLFIDVVPPMESWWYGVPTLNLANIVVNVEALLSIEAGKHVERGFMDYHHMDQLPASEYAFTKALAYAISAVHFGSIAGKEDVARRYFDGCALIPTLLANSSV